MSKLDVKYKSRGFQVIAVNAENRESREVVAKFAQRNKLTHRILVGGEEVSDLYHVEQVFPTTFWIDHGGRIIRREVGFRPEMEKVIEGMILELLRIRDGETKDFPPKHEVKRKSPSNPVRQSEGKVGKKRGAKEEVSTETLERMQKLFFEASDFYMEKEYRKAIQTFRKLLAILPKGKDFQNLHASANVSIAASFSVLGEQKEAIFHLEKAVENGFLDKRRLIFNPAFESIRQLDGYQNVLKDMGRRMATALDTFDFSLTTMEGKPIKKKDFLGKVLVVNIWGTWCSWCHIEIPHFIELQRRYESQGLRILGFSSEQIQDLDQARRKVKEFMEKKKISYPCAVVTEKYLDSIPNFNSYPTTLVFGRDGKPRAMEVGARDLEALEAIVKPLLEEKAPEAPPPEQSPAGEPEKP